LDELFAVIQNSVVGKIGIKELMSWWTNFVVCRSCTVIEVSRSVFVLKNFVVYGGAHRPTSYNTLRADKQNPFYPLETIILCGAVTDKQPHCFSSLLAKVRT
jgi:hypothetical protein